MQQERLTYLLIQYGNDTATVEEAAELRRFIQENDSSELFDDTVAELMKQYQPDENVTPLFPPGVITSKAHQVDKLEEYPSGPIRRMPSWGWAAAAVALIVCAAGFFQLARPKQEVAIITSVDKAPGKNGAILTLADGTQVVLDSLQDGVVAAQNGARVSLKEGGLNYDPVASGAHEVAYNTITTPKGRQFQVRLPDGTGVWLNAGSTLTFPTAFTGKERKVRVEGEAYFEVAKNEQLPFAVDVKGQGTIEVLGTKFNIQAYTGDMSMHTTLLQGSVRIVASRQSVVIRPGEQALSAGNDITVKALNSAEIERIVAWKNGVFNFEGLSLKEAMLQLERWYDVRIQFKGSADRQMFGGEMNRNVHLSDMLEVLKKMEVKYEWDGKTLTIF